MIRPTTIAAAIAHGERALPKREGLPDPRREARWLLARALGRDETWLLVHPEDPLPATVSAAYRGWLARRAAGEPAHHLVGTCPFWGRDFRVSPAALVPRPETELLVQAVLDLSLPDGARVVDVGTGTGCIAASLALERPLWSVNAIDTSMAALALSRHNIRILAAPVGVAAGNLIEAVGRDMDLLVANLPYLPSADLAGLPEEVRHDPVVALDGGLDGLYLVRRLIADAPRVLAPGGGLALELGEGQAEEVVELAAKVDLREERRVCDLGGVERVVVVRRT